MLAQTPGSTSVLPTSDRLVHGRYICPAKSGPPRQIHDLCHSNNLESKDLLQLTMLRGLLIFGSVLTVFGATLWQLLLRDAFFITLGVGRVIQTLDEFPYTCRLIPDERLIGCEDLWLDDENRL